MRMNLSNIGHDFIIYDGVNLSDHFTVRTFDMPLLPSIEASSIEIDGKAGSWFSRRKIMTRDIIIGLGILNDTKDRDEIMETWFLLSDKLAKDRPCKMEIGKGLYVNAMFVGESGVTTRKNWSIINATFRCFDPYIYGEEHTETLKSGSNTIYVKGKYPTYPRLALTASSTTVQVQDMDTSDRVRIPSTVSGNTIVIDTENCKTMLNGVYKAVDPTVTDFWPLRVGENKLTLTGCSGTLTYREMYL